MESSPNSDLYVAVILYESWSPDPSYTPMYEECFALVRAESEEQARARAEQHSRAHETCFNNVLGQEIHWKLKHVVDVSRVLSDTLDDGADIYARHFKSYEAYHAFEPLLGGRFD
ncbi:DUF4288 domain-containing protein [Sorangium sp. So ce302]|uniref:DUF4288 domain-containing protein n=1 Tax=unclassified Sorangium TaxID=2621164 RepID=UPI003F5F16FD